MYKLLVLCSLISLYAAAPSDTLAAQPQLTALPPLIAESAHILLHEPALAKLGEVVESVPTAVSHQSQTIVHSRAHRVTPIVAPAVRSYSTSLIEHAPLFRAFPARLGPAPAYMHIHAPLQLSTYAASPAYATRGYAGWRAPLIYAAGSPFFK